MTSLEQWRANGWLRPHEASRDEIQGLLSVVDRDLNDAEQRIVSPDWRFNIAYNAALKLCAILVHASGYRPERTLHHYRLIHALPLVLGKRRADDAAYLDACRIKRNTSEYEMAGVTSTADADELVAFARDLRRTVLEWLMRHHRDVSPI